MRDPKWKPKSYINHDDVMNKVMIEKNRFTMFLHENMMNFYGDIEDIANTLNVFSETDSYANGVEYHYANHLYIHQLQDECALVESLAVTEYNTSG